MPLVVPGLGPRLGLALAASLLAATGACQGPDPYYRNADGGAGHGGTAGLGGEAGTVGTTGAAGAGLAGTTGTAGTTGAAGSAVTGAAGTGAAGTGSLPLTGGAGTGAPCTKCMVKVQYTCRSETKNDAGADTGQASFVLDVTNNAAIPIPLADLTLRYWYTADTTSAQQLDCDYAKLGCTNVSTSANQPPAPLPKFQAVMPPRLKADTYVEVSFSAGALTLDPFLGTGEIQLRLHNKDYSLIMQDNDYSYDEAACKTKTTIESTKITAYVKGVLVWGTEP